MSTNYTKSKILKIGLVFLMIGTLSSCILTRVATKGYQAETTGPSALN